MTDKQLQFVNQYVIDFNGTQAAIRAGYSENGAGVAAFELLTNPNILAAVAERQAELAAAAGLSCQWVLRQWKQIAEADPSELIRVKLECCRHCYGLEHEYQWSEFEYRAAIGAARAHRCTNKCHQPCAKTVPPPAPGGFGFDPHKHPSPECPVCHGEGNERIIVADTKRVTGSARRLYVGVKKTKDGIEIKMRDQDGALKNIAQYLGMVIDKKELTGRDGGPIPVAHYKAEDLTDDQLAQLVLQESAPAVE